MSHTPLEAFLLLVLFIQTQEMKQLIQKAFLSFLLLIFFFLNLCALFHCCLLGKEKQWFQTVLLWESEALQVDKALSSDGVHVQAGCSE